MLGFDALGVALGKFTFAPGLKWVANDFLKIPVSKAQVATIDQLKLDDKDAKQYLEQCFDKWIKSDAFETLLKEAKTRGVDITTRDVAASFQDATEHDPGDTRFNVDDVLTNFVRHLTVELAASSSSFSEALASARHDEQREAILGLEQKFDKLQEAFYALLARTSDDKQSTDTRDDKEMGLHGEVDVARNHIDEGRSNKGRSQLLKMLEQHPKEHLSEYLRFRINNILGVAELRLGNKTESRMRFDLAVELRPKSAIVNANLAAYELRFGDPKDAVKFSDKALAADSKSPLIAAIHLVSLYAAGETDRLQAFKSDTNWLASYPETIAALGQNAFDSDDYQQAQALFEQVIDKNPTDIESLCLLALSIYKPICIEASDDTPLDGKVDEENEQKLRRSHQLLSQGIEIARKWDFFDPLIRLLTARAAVSLGLMDLDSAFADYSEVFTLDSNDHVAKLGRATVLFVRSEYKEALAEIESLAGDEMTDASHLLLDCYLRLGNLQKAREYLPLVENRPKVSAALKLYGKLSTTPDNEIDAMIQQVLRDGVAVRDKLIIAQRLRVAKRGDDAIKMLEGIPNSERTRWVKRELADLYFEKGRYIESAGIYEGFVDESKDSVDLRNYISAIANSGTRLATAGQLARKLREKLGGLAIKGITEIEVAYYGNQPTYLTSSRTLLVELIQNKSDSPLTWMMLRRLNLELRKAPFALD